MNEEYIKNSHCSYCGTRFTEQVAWPRKCFRCYNDSYSNPLPVVVVFLNVWEGNKLGTLIQQRNIQPKKGEWALTGGYIDGGETWQEAAGREVYEELGIKTIPNGFHLLEVHSNTSKSNLLIFCSYLQTLRLEDIHFTPNEEVSAIQIVHDAVELAFPTHTEMLGKRFPSHLKG